MSQLLFRRKYGDEPGGALWLGVKRVRFLKDILRKWLAEHIFQLERENMGCRPFYQSSNLSTKRKWLIYKMDGLAHPFYT